MMREKAPAQGGERRRLEAARQGLAPWRKWGPYLSERQWGTVREDYSADGNAWQYFPHAVARSRAYRWGEDGLLGICDREGRMCFAVALWNEKLATPADGVALTTDEVFNLKLGGPLVMLSACETGLGKEKRGEGVMGLTRAFMYAGAPTVGVSLWSVADKSTADLMTDFYRRLLSATDTPSSSALREAQLAMISGKKYSAPFYWAPFVLSGEVEDLLEHRDDDLDLVDPGDVDHRVHHR
jgi:hypothetical protein